MTCAETARHFARGKSLKAMLMIAKKPPKSGKRMGRPPTVAYVRRTTLNLSAEEVRRIDGYRAHVERLLPHSRLTEPQLLAQIVALGLDAFEQREAQASQPELPLPESSTTKQKPK